MTGLSPQVRRWLSEGSPSTGPLALPPPEAALDHPLSPRTLAGRAPEGPAPLVHLAEIAGTPLYLHTGNGAVISLHHDATLLEVADEASGHRTPEAFADALALRGSGIDLDALRSLARAVAPWPRWRPQSLTAGERAHAIALGLGLEPATLAKALRQRPTVFEWLLIEPGDLEAPARPEPQAPPAPQAPLKTVEKLPLSENDLAGASATRSPRRIWRCSGSSPRWRGSRSGCRQAPCCQAPSRTSGCSHSSAARSRRFPPWSR